MASLAHRALIGRASLWDQSARPPDLQQHLHAPANNLLTPWMVGLPQLVTLAPEQAFKTVVLPRVPRGAQPLIVDVGANNGQFAVSVVRAGHRSLSFEPSPRTCAKLKRRVERARSIMHGSPEKNVVRCAAVGATSGTIMLEEDAGSSASFRIASRRSRGATRAVPVVRLDDEVPLAERDLILKTDTQGFELNVLRGAHHMLGRVRLLMLEMSNGLLKAQGASPFELMQWVAAHGFDCTHLRFFSMKARRARGRRARFGPVPLPPLLHHRQTVSFQEMDALLRRTPPFNHSGWTDLLCWRANATL
tara:strand:+ start:358 stop:1272 length:915 start_codon:yes stop_codon:yes gene_type:complete